jgi:hypothetical protein
MNMNERASKKYCDRNDDAAATTQAVGQASTPPTITKSQLLFINNPIIYG